MKQFFLLLGVLVFTLHGYSQEQPTPLSEKQQRFSIGLDYDWMSTGLKLTSMSFHSVWAGQDLGMETLTAAEIDSINTFVDYSNRFQDLHLEAGMIFLDKPSSKWTIDGRIMLGLVKRSYEVINTSTTQTDLLIRSEVITPSIGYTMNISYDFNSHWGMRVVPYVVYSWGKSTRVEDNLHPLVDGMTENRSNRSDYLYARLNVLGALTFNHITVFAGPGIYLLRIWNNYEMIREDPVDGNTYEDDIKSGLISPYFIDATFALEWQFVPWMSVNLKGAAGADFMVSAGIRYHL